MLNSDLLLILTFFVLGIAFLETVAVVSLVAVALGHPKIVESTFDVVNRLFDAIILFLGRHKGGGGPPPAGDN